MSEVVKQSFQRSNENYLLFIPTQLIETTLIYARVKRENLKKLGESLDTSWTQTAIREIDAL